MLEGYLLKLFQAWHRLQPRKLIDARLFGRATSRAMTPTRSPPLYHNARLSPHRHPWCLRRMLCSNSGPYDDTVVNTVHRSPPSLPPLLTGTSPQHPHLRQQRAPQEKSLEATLHSHALSI